MASDYDPAFFADGGIERVRQAVQRGALPRVSLTHVRVGAPLARPGKLMAIGLNYHDHAREMGSPVPDRPILFDKATSAICGPHDDVRLPTNYDSVDYEVELALVIGTRGTRLTEQNALDYVGGYLLCNDVSERTAQKLEGGQWYRGKSFDTFAPLGPYLVTPDELGDPHALRLKCIVDGSVRQDGTTSELIFKIPALLAFISRNITLEPGDILTTGTPAGVAMGEKPPRYLREGQLMELEGTGLGRQKTRLVRDPD